MSASDAPAPVEVIFTNLHWRYTGVTAANRRIAPRVAGRLRAAWLGRHRPEGVAALDWGGLWRLRGELRRRGARAVWFARRNEEMLAGVLLRGLGWPLRLVCLSAAQREHSRYTHALYRRMDAIIATSEIARQRVGWRATVIPHGVDVVHFSPPADRGRLLADRVLPGRWALGCFGRVREQKGTDVFVAALCELLPRHPGWTGVVVGAVTPQHEAFAAGLRRQVAAAGLEGRVVFAGEQPEESLPGWFGALTVYAFCSRIEGFGLTLLEAMASGNAVVAARAGAAEQLIRDGENGRLVPPGNVAALVAALEPLLADPAQAAALGARARADAEQAHSLEREAEAIAAFLARVRGE